MAFRNFIYTKDDKDLAFLPKDPSSGFGTGSLCVLVNTKPLKANEEPEGHVKRKLAPGSLTSHATRAKTSSLKDDTPFLIVFDDDEDLRDRCYLRHAVVDNVINRRSRELLQVIEKLRGEFNVMRNMERERKEECEGMHVKCEAAMTKFEKNPAVVALREKIFVLSTKVKEHKLNLDMMMLESQKWAGYQQSLLTLESKVDSLEVEKARLEAIEVSLRKEASNDFSIATFPWLDEFVADPLAPIEVLLSKKPLSFQRHVPSRTQVLLPTS
nr:hypothetical protein [Tanacetum cinerariifolium]